VGNQKACGSQWRAVGVPQAIRIVLYFCASPQVQAAQLAGGIEVRCAASRCVTEYAMMETTRKAAEG